jgi:diguanylate cyclase
VEKDDYKRALRYSESAIDLLKRGQVPPYPRFYELLYTYATAVNPALNTRVNDLFGRGVTPGTELVEALYQEFMQSQGMNERLTSVSEEIATRINAVHQAIDTALSEAHGYSGVLENASGQLAVEMDKKSLKKLTDRLLEETLQMHATNVQLEDNLKSTSDDVAALRTELEDVRRESMLDPLTRVYNRQAFDRGLANSIEDANRSGEPLSLMLIDIDHFKAFNDTHGHQTGDQVLRLVATMLKNGVRGKDIAARYGGEEFAAVLPSASLGEAVKIAEALVKTVQEKKLHKRSTNEKLGRITICVGVAKYRPDDSASSLIERADKCLYAGKHNGRNQVVDERSKLLNKGPGDASVA